MLIRQILIGICLPKRNNKHCKNFQSESSTRRKIQSNTISNQGCRMRVSFTWTMSSEHAGSGGGGSSPPAAPPPPSGPPPLASNPFDSQNLFKRSSRLFSALCKHVFHLWLCVAGSGPSFFRSLKINRIPSSNCDGVRRSAGSLFVWIRGSMLCKRNVIRWFMSEFKVYLSIIGKFRAETITKFIKSLPFFAFLWTKAVAIESLGVPLGREYF